MKPSSAFRSSRSSRRRLADNGFIVLRYDKRGVGQSGGRTETATLADYADDVIAAVQWLAKRNDVDQRKIVVCGHSEGGAVALIAAAREKKIDGVVAIASPGRNRRRSDPRAAAAISSTAEGVGGRQAGQDRAAEEDPGGGRQRERLGGHSRRTLRKQADTPWFKSLLTFDPAEALGRAKQPLLIVQGDLDTQVAPENADKLAELARASKKAGAVEVVHIPGINHLLVPATTGEVSEYGQLKDHTVTPKVAEAIVEWLKKSF